MNREIIEITSSFNCLGSFCSRNGGLKVSEELKTFGVKKMMCNVGSLRLGVKTDFYVRAVVSTETHTVYSEMLGYDNGGVSRMGEVKIVEVKHRVGVKKKMSDKINRKILKWFGHVKQ